MTREQAIKEYVIPALEYAWNEKIIKEVLEALEQEDVTWIVGNDNVQIAVRNMPVDMMQKINAIIGNLQEPTTQNNCAERHGCITCSLDDGDDCCRKLYEESMQESTTKNDLGVDTDKLIADCEKMSFDFELFGRPTKALLLDAVKNIVKELPSVTPQEPRWILVSEKLPNDRDWYLGIFKEPDTGWINPLPFICDYVGRETKATTKEYWILRGFTDRDYKDCDYYYNLECVAWMPLPKGYEEVEK